MSYVCQPVASRFVLRLADSLVYPWDGYKQLAYRPFQLYLYLCVKTSLWCMKPFTWRCVLHTGSFSCKWKSFSFKCCTWNTCFDSEAHLVTKKIQYGLLLGSLFLANSNHSSTAIMKLLQQFNFRLPVLYYIMLFALGEGEGFCTTTGKLQPAKGA